MGDFMRAHRVGLPVHAIAQPADASIQPALIAEIAEAQAAVRAATQQRDQAIYYLLGLVVAILAFLANGMLSGGLAVVLARPHSSRFIVVAVIAQFLSGLVAFLALVVFGVVYAANDTARFRGREVARLNDVLYGYPGNPAGLGTPAWIAVQANAHDLRDRDDTFGVGWIAETIAMMICGLSMLGLLAVTILTCVEAVYWARIVSVVLLILLGGSVGVLYLTRVHPLHGKSDALREFDEASRRAQEEALSQVEGREPSDD